MIFVIGLRLWTGTADEWRIPRRGIYELYDTITIFMLQFWRHIDRRHVCIGETAVVLHYYTLISEYKSGRFRYLPVAILSKLRASPSESLRRTFCTSDARR